MTVSPIVVALLLTGGGAPGTFDLDWLGASGLDHGGGDFAGDGGAGASLGAGGDNP